jgi:hypothetical protein
MRGAIQHVKAIGAGVLCTELQRSIVSVELPNEEGWEATPAVHETYPQYLYIGAATRMSWTLCSGGETWWHGETRHE